MVLDEEGVAVATTEEGSMWMDMVVMGPRKRGRRLERVVPQDGARYLLGQEISHGHCTYHYGVFCPGPERAPAGATGRKPP